MLARPRDVLEGRCTACSTWRRMSVWSRARRHQGPREADGLDVYAWRDRPRRQRRHPGLTRARQGSSRGRRARHHGVDPLPVGGRLETELLRRDPVQQPPVFFAVSVYRNRNRGRWPVLCTPAASRAREKKSNSSDHAARSLDDRFVTGVPRTPPGCRSNRRSVTTIPRAPSLTSMGLHHVCHVAVLRTVERDALSRRLPCR